MRNRRLLLAAAFAALGIFTAMGTGEGRDGSGPDDPDININVVTVSTRYFQIAVADFNDDGFDDLAALGHRPRDDGSFDNRLELFLRDAADSSAFSRFAQQTIEVTDGNLLAGDVDRDGIIDVVVSQPDLGNVTVLRQLDPSTGIFAGRIGYVVGAGAGALAGADVDLDGLPDILAATTSGVSVRVQATSTPGTFPTLRVIDDSRDASTAPAAGMATLQFADLDGDGLGDIIAARADATLRYDQNTGVPGTFSAPSEITFATPPHAVVASDLDADGAVDLIGTAGAVVAVRLQDRTDPGVFRREQSFATAAGTSARFLAVGDVNSDGRADIVVGAETADGSATVQVFLQSAGPGFSLMLDAVYDIPSAASPLTGLALADVDSDRVPDVVAVKREIHIFPNEPSEPGSLGAPRQITGR